MAKLASYCKTATGQGVRLEAPHTRLGAWMLRPEAGSARGLEMLLKLSGSLRQVLRSSDRRTSLGKSAGKTGANPEHLFLRARALVRSGEKKIAISILQQASDLDPAFSDAIESQGEVLDSLGDSAAAAAKYNLARNIRRHAPRGTPDRHFVWRQLSPPTAEVSAYSSVIKSLRKHALPYLARGNAYLVGSQPERALADYERALRLLRSSLDVLALKGEALVGMGRYVDAVEIFNRVIEARPTDFDALNSRGIARMALGQVAEANADWKRQIELMAGRVAANAYAALRMADYETALAFLQRGSPTDQAHPYWSLYTLSASLRLRRTQPASVSGADDWPALLRRYLLRRATADEVLAQADTPSRQGEARFQFGILAFGEDPAAARQHWQKVLEVCPPTLVEFAAARNELVQPGN